LTVAQIRAGNCATASALFADGANCSAGSYPLGVDASGAAQSCTADDDVPEVGDFGALALAGDVTSSGLTTTIAVNSVALGPDTTNNYVTSVATNSPLTGGAAGSEGAALTLGLDLAALTLAGDVDGAANANDLDETAVESELEAVLDIPQLQGSATCSQLPALTGDATTSAGSCAVTIGADKILESMLKAVNSPTDEFSLTYEATTGDFEWQAGGGGGTPGGADTQVQFNDASAFGGDAGLTYNKTTDALTAGQVNADSMRLDGSTVSSTGTDVSIDAASGNILARKSLYAYDGANVFAGIVHSQGVKIASNMQLLASSTTAATGAADAGIERAAAGVWNLTDGSTGVGKLKKTVSDTETLSVADNGTGSAATATLTPTKSYIKCNCSDANGCDVTMGETGMIDGWQFTVVNISVNACNFADTSGLSELPAGGISLGQWDAISGIYVTDRFVVTSTSNN
jgi:hypothetical protein